jgi:hypothetical protein
VLVAAKRAVPDRPLSVSRSHEGCTQSCCVACGAGFFGWVPAIAYTVFCWDPKPILLQAHELSIDDWLATLGAEVLKEELDALGAETCEDLERLDDEDMELLVTAATAKLKKLKAKKFIRALGASSAAPKRRNSGKHIGAESHNMAR